MNAITYGEHHVIDPAGVVKVRTIYRAGEYVVSERDLGLRGAEYRVAHLTTGVVIRSVWRAGLACDLADALESAFFPGVGGSLSWGDRAGMEAIHNRAGDPAAVIARVLATDNPHGEPPPNPCPTCGRVKVTP